MMFYNQLFKGCMTQAYCSYTGHFNKSAPTTLSPCEITKFGAKRLKTTKAVIIFSTPLSIVCYKALTIMTPGMMIYFICTVSLLLIRFHVTCVSILFFSNNCRRRKDDRNLMTFFSVSVFNVKNKNELFIST